jgi:hypothetical protein
MRERKTIPTVQNAEPSIHAWLDMDRNVLVEVTPEEKAHLVESSLLPDEMKTVVGVRPIQALKQSALSSMSLKR